MLYLTLRQYEYLCAIARHGSLSAAAEALNTSQPTLSAALAKIETHLGQDLFLRRRGASLALTRQGQDFAKRAQKLLDQAAMLEQPDARPPATRKLVLGCFTDLAPFLLAPALQALRQAFPEMSIRSKTAEFEPLTRAMLDFEVDVALTYDLGLDAGFSRRILHYKRPHVLVPPDHTLAQQEAVSLADLAKEPLILSHEGLSVQHILSLFKNRGVTPTVAHRASSLELLRSLAANSEGVGLSYSLPPGNMSYDGKALAAIPIRDANAQEPVILACRGEFVSGTIQEKAATILEETFGTAAETPKSKQVSPA